MKKYIIAKLKNGGLTHVESMLELKQIIDNVASWLTIKADTLKDAIEKFPEIEARYNALNDSERIKHIFNPDED